MSPRQSSTGGLAPSRHPADAYVGPDGYRNLTMESDTQREGDVIRVRDRTREPVVALMELTPGGLDFLIDSLPQNDGVTEQLRYARRLAQAALWDRSA